MVGVRLLQDAMLELVEQIFNNTFGLIYEILKTIFLSVIPISFYRKKSVKGDIVLITGGANGLGREMAIRFAKLGARVVIWDVDKPASERTCRLVEEVGGFIKSYYCDVANREAVYETAKKVKTEVGKVDIVVNSAGIVHCDDFIKKDDAQIQKMFQINTLSNFWVVKAFLPEMMAENHGHIVSMSSISGCIGADVMIDYSSSKHALNGFHEGLAIYLHARGCDKVYTTNCCTYLIDTEMFKIMYTGFVPMMELGYAVDCMMTAVLTNTEMYFLPKLLNLLMLLRPILSARALYHIQSIFSDRDCSKTIQVREVESDPKAYIL